MKVNEPSQGIIDCIWSEPITAPLALLAQQHSPRIPQIGFLGDQSALGFAPQVEALQAGLRDFGYIEGKNILIEFRWA